MAFDTLDLTRSLAFIGLLLGAAAYYTLIRRRRRDADELQARDREASRLRARARFRRLRRHDER